MMTDSRRFTGILFPTLPTPLPPQTAPVSVCRDGDGQVERSSFASSKVASSSPCLFSNSSPKTFTYDRFAHPLSLFHCSHDALPYSLTTQAFIAANKEGSKASCSGKNPSFDIIFTLFNLKANDNHTIHPI